MAVKLSSRSSNHLIGRRSSNAAAGIASLFRMEHGFGTKAAADIGRDDAHLMFQKTQRLHHHGLGAMRRLRAVPYRQQIFAGVIARDHAARLDREAAAFFHAKLLGEPMRRIGENAIRLRRN